MALPSNNEIANPLNSGAFWSAVAAVASAFATVIALLTLLRAVRLDLKRNRDLRAEQRATHYRSLVSVPLSSAADALVASVKASAQSAFEGTCGAGNEEIREAIRGASIERFEIEFQELKHELRVGTRAWGDTQLAWELVRESDDWQDVINDALQRMPAEDCLEVIRKGCTAYRTALRKVTMQYDPVLAHHVSAERDEGLVRTVCAWIVDHFG